MDGEDALHLHLKACTYTGDRNSHHLPSHDTPTIHPTSGGHPIALHTFEPCGNLTSRSSWTSFVLANLLSHTHPPSPTPYPKHLTRACSWTSRAEQVCWQCNRFSSPLHDKRHIRSNHQALAPSALCHTHSEGYTKRLNIRYTDL